jgi:hypothetical protein
MRAAAKGLEKRLAKTGVAAKRLAKKALEKKALEKKALAKRGFASKRLAKTALAKQEIAKRALGNRRLARNNLGGRGERSLEPRFRSRPPMPSPKTDRWPRRRSGACPQFPQSGRRARWRPPRSSLKAGPESR